jgi:hypothetical protein
MRPLCPNFVQLADEAQTGRNREGTQCAPPMLFRTFVRNVPEPRWVWSLCITDNAHPVRFKPLRGLTLEKCQNTRGRAVSALVAHERARPHQSQHHWETVTKFHIITTYIHNHRTICRRSIYASVNRTSASNPNLGFVAIVPISEVQTTYNPLVVLSPALLYWIFF